MIRSCLLLSATLLTLHSVAVFGLGLGKLELNSALNQTFNAEIDLVDTAGLEPEEIVPALAPLEDFNRYGVEFTYVLSDLRFKVRRHDLGGLYLEVVSTNPIREPFFNFIVEVRWPNGKLLSEYTVLLDPPILGEERIASIQPAESATTTQKIAGSERQRRETLESTTSPPMTQGEVLGDDYGVTGLGDTLWSIALKVRPNELVTIQQTMLALQRLNPDAFINNNINLLKAGHVLRIPSFSEIGEETPSDAVSQVRIQHHEFETYKSSGVAQLDATDHQLRETSEDVGREDGELRLLAANSSRGQRAGDSNAHAADLENELAITRGDLDRARRSNSELNIQLDDLEGQIETLNEIVKLKDDQLAEWRAEMQKLQDTAATRPAPIAWSEGSLLTNPLLLDGLLVLVIVGLVAVMLVMRKRKRKERSELEEEEFDDVLLLEEETSREDAQPEEFEEESDEVDAALDDTASLQADEMTLDGGPDLDDELDPIDFDEEVAINADLDSDDDLGDLDPETGKEVNLDLDDDDLDDLDFDEDASSKLDLARAYVDMGDNDGARALLNEVTLEGDSEQIQEANELLEKLD